MVYYNEIEPFTAAWLRELMADGQIPVGDVDERSIVEVTADDVRGYRQCHFFAGIGGWAYALRLAGWPESRPVWTGSCPCQPFSSAGQREGGGDDRHLWPHWARLIRECRPGTVFGEQVESAIAHGWLDAVFDDLEREGYACGAACLPAASVGAPHLRQRVWFVAQPVGAGLEGYAGNGDLAAGRAQSDRSTPATSATPDGPSGLDALPVLRGLPLHNSPDARLRVSLPSDRGVDDRSLWADAEWLPCRDGKARPAQPGIFPLAHGVSDRVGILRGTGNAIVPQVAAEVIRAYMEIDLGETFGQDEPA